MKWMQQTKFSCHSFSISTKQFFFFFDHSMHNHPPQSPPSFCKYSKYQRIRQNIRHIYAFAIRLRLTENQQHISVNNPGVESWQMVSFFLVRQKCFSAHSNSFFSLMKDSWRFGSPVAIDSTSGWPWLNLHRQC